MTPDDRWPALVRETIVLVNEDVLAQSECLETRDPAGADDVAD